MTYLRKFGTLLTALTALAAANGCASDTLDSGDYMVFRVAFTSSTPAASCYVDGEIPMSIVEDTTSLRSGGTFIMYAAEEGGLYLDTGDMVLEGEKNGPRYDFDGKTVDVEYPNVEGQIYDSDHDGIDDYQDDFVDADGDGLEDTTADDFVDVDLDGLDDRYDDPLVDANGDGIDDNYVDLQATYKFKDSRELQFKVTVDGDVVTGKTKTIIRSTCEGTGCPLEYGAECTVKGEFDGVVIDDAQVDVSLGAPTDDTGSSASANQGD